MRKQLFKWHSTAALIALIPLIVISVTGSILVFKTEIDTWLMPEHMTVAPGNQLVRQDLNALVRHVETTYPSYLIGSWEIFDNKQRADTTYLLSKTDGSWFKMYVDQYQNTLLSQPVSVTHDITDWLLSLHYTFLMEFTGTVLGSIFAIILLFLGISGIILYRQFWKKLFTIRFKAAKRVLFSDVHKFIGIISSPIILVLAITGGYFNIAEVVHEVTEHMEEHPVLKEKLYNEAVDLEGLLIRSKTDIADFNATYLTFPFEAERHFTFFGEVPTGNPLTSEYASTVTYDRNSGELIVAYDIRQASSLNVVLDTFRKLHFGYFGGLTVKIIYCVLGLSPLWLALTGLYFFWFRKRKKRHNGSLSTEPLTSASTI